MLNGIKIVDFTNYIPGPFATLRLAELGAEIIKVESPEGDPARNTGPGKEGTGLVFLAHNRRKKSIAINLKSEEGRRIALGLISKADALVESFRPGVMDKLGLGYSQVSAVNPRLVYCSITGYGDKGPMSSLGSHDLNYMAVSGILAQLKDESGRPVHPSNTFADYIGGMAASERILAGLVSRAATGNGSFHCLAIADVMASLMANHVLFEKEMGVRHGVALLNGEIVSYALYETTDGRFVSLGALEPKFWRNFCLAVGREDWLPAHFSKVNGTNPVYVEMMALFKSKTLFEWTEFSQNVDCCMAPVLETNELSENSYFKEKEIIYDPAWGGRQVKMHGGIEEKAGDPPPEKGAHSGAILKEWLRASEEQISRWKDEGAIQ